MFVLLLVFNFNFLGIFGSVDRIPFLILGTKDCVENLYLQFPGVGILRGWVCGKMVSKFELPSTKTVISTAASVAATAMLVRSFANDCVPHELRRYILTKFHRFFATFTNEITLIIDEFDGLVKNQLYCAAEIYLSTISSPSTRTFRASIPEKEKKIKVSVGKNEDLMDRFCGFQLKWRMVNQQSQLRYVPYPDDYHSTMKTEVRYLELTFHKKHKNKVLDEYLPFILERSKAVKEGKRTLKLHTLKNDRVHGPTMNPWQAVNLDHPATFETLAMDDETKKMVIDDLDRFLKRKEFYRKVGKAWKRGYLLFGPPGTGKSSLIAAMANYLNFDVYDLELTDLRCNSDLRRLLIWTANRSILVVEDIDASIDLSDRNTQAARRHTSMYNYQHNQEPKVTLSGLLNFTDGLWSSCGDERIVIFTTNHIDKLDQALLRPGRMDVHIHMSYCTPCGFKMLVSNYLGTLDHPLVLKAEGMMSVTNVTPAEVAEQLLKNDNPEHALQGLIEFLELKKESDRVKAESLEVTKREVVENLEKNEDESAISPMNVKSSNGLKELVKMCHASPAEMREQVLKNNEAVNALKVLIGIFGGGNGNGDVKDSDLSSLSSQVVSMPKSKKEDESKAE